MCTALVLLDYPFWTSVVMFSLALIFLGLFVAVIWLDRHNAKKRRKL